MVPASFGCGSGGLAAMAIFAPSRAARRPIASPMPREAPVMNRVLPTSVMRPRRLLLACEEGGKSGARLFGFQTLLKERGFGIDPRGDGVKIIAQQAPSQRHRAGGQRGDLARGLHCRH